MSSLQIIFFFQTNEIAGFDGLNSLSSLTIQCVLASYNTRGGLGFTFALSYFGFNILPFCCKRRVVVWHPSHEDESCMCSSSSIFN